MKRNVLAFVILALLVAVGIVLQEGTLAQDELVCNTPPYYFPDGCGRDLHIAPPDAQIPPPCIKSVARFETPDPDEGTIRLIDTLQVTIEHPEYTGGEDQVVTLQRSPTTGAWSVYRVDTWFKCGCDELPLAWSLREALNRESGQPFVQAYGMVNIPGLEEVIHSEVLKEHLYLPLIRRTR